MPRLSHGEDTFSIRSFEENPSGNAERRHFTLNQLTLYHSGTEKQKQMPVGGKTWLCALANSSQSEGDGLTFEVQKRVVDHFERIGGFIPMLERVLEDSDERATSPIRFTRSPKALQVSGKQEVRFRLVVEGNTGTWGGAGLLPFPKKEDLIICQNPKAISKSTVELRWQQPKKGKKPPYMRLARVVHHEGRICLDVRFPLGVDQNSIPTSGYLTADRPLPAERTMIRELRNWTRHERDHPVASALVGGMRTQAELPAFTPVNPALANNPAQMDAVKLGLSDIPLGLIKGPPGTGKSTVIGEIIHQMATEGKKVLLCSQTHQAVRNVLEALHESGRVRMVRYGRDENLTDIETQYAAGGQAAGLKAGTMERARSRAEIERGRFLECAEDVIAYEKAIQALEKLSELEASRTEDLQNNERNAAEEQQRVEGAYLQCTREIREKEVQSLNTIDQRHEQNDVERVHAQKGLDLLRRRFSLLQVPLPDLPEAGSHDRMAKTGEKQKRLRNALLGAELHGQRSSALHKELETLNEQISNAQHKKDEAEQTAQKRFQHKKETAEATCEQEVLEAASEKDQLVDDAEHQHQSDLSDIEEHYRPEIKEQESLLKSIEKEVDHLRKKTDKLSSELLKLKEAYSRRGGQGAPSTHAGRGHLIRRVFSARSPEVIEGEFAHKQTVKEDWLRKYENAVDKADKQRETLNGLKSELEQKKNQLADERTEAVDSAANAYKETVEISRQTCQAVVEQAEAERDMAVSDAERVWRVETGDAPVRKERLAPLVSLEEELHQWHQEWMNRLVESGEEKESINEGVQEVMHRHGLPVADDECEPEQKALRERQATAVWKSIGQKLAGTENEIVQLSQQREEAILERKTAEDAAENRFRDQKEQIEMERKKKEVLIHRRYEDEESNLKTRIEEAVHLAGQQGLEAGIKDTPRQWQKRIDDREPEIHRQRELADFTENWVKDLSASPSEVERLHWRYMDAFFATCVGVASWRQLTSAGREAVDLVIIDEAAHATLPETIPPLRLGKRVLLIGDEMQLPPISMDDLDAVQPEGDWLSPDLLQVGEDTGPVPMSDRWMERSLFEWAYNRLPHIPRVMLDRQFRMHPDIGTFVGDIFYSGDLKNGVTAAERDLTFGDFRAPVCIVSTSRYPDRHEKQIRSKGSGSYSNPLEIRFIEQILEHADRNLSTSAGFGIITPYAAQKEKMKTALRQASASWKHVKMDPDEDIGSVDSYQGSQRDCIIVSLTRSPPLCSVCRGDQTGKRCSACGGKGFKGSGLRFVRDLRRLNVAFSRARCQLILIGDMDLLCNDKARGGKEGGRVLASFRDHVLRRGQILHVWEHGHG